jgi:hypothetical protein
VDQRELSLIVFGGKQNYEFWQTIFEAGRSPQGQQVLPEPLNLMDMIPALAGLLSKWAIQDSNLGPLPYQRSALTD